MMGSFKSELEEKATIYNIELNSINEDFLLDITGIISSKEDNLDDLKYVFFVNHVIAGYVRNHLISILHYHKNGKVDIDKFFAYGVEFRVERNTVSDMNIIRPDVKQIVPQDYHKIIMLKIQ